MIGGSARTLGELAGSLTGVTVPRTAAGIRVHGIAVDSRRIRPGDLFVAVAGNAADGHGYIGEAVARGAVAVVAGRDAGPVQVPVLRVDDPRTALSELAAAWNGFPADRLRLVGITGTLGKTSVITMLESIVAAAGEPIGTIGSLGIRLRGALDERSRLTTPDPLALHQALAGMEAAGARAVAMEVTSHAIAQRRIHGVAFDLGIFTNLVLLEHLDYHGTFRNYAAVKQRFLDQVRAGAPLVYPAGDRAVRALVRVRDLTPVSCGAGGRVSVRVNRLVLGRGGTRVTIRVRRPLPRVDGGAVLPITLPLELRVLGRPNICNAALAATAALCLGVRPAAIRRALAAFPAPWRRMQLTRHGRFRVLDDTVGHPDSISAVFEVARRIRHRRLHAVYAIRGRRGEPINRRDAETVAISARHTPLATLVVTSSEDTADEENRVEPGEREAFLDALKRNRLEFEYRDRLDDAIRATCDRVGDGDLLLLLGAQGMNAGANLLRRRLG